MGDHATDALNEAIEVWGGPALHAHTRCKYCGNRNVRWQKTDHGWRLHSLDGEIHTCPEYTSKAKRSIKP